MNTPTFPTKLHEEAAGVVSKFFSTLPTIDTVLVTNSCARGLAVPESDLDFAILVKPNTTKIEVKEIETKWQNFNKAEPTLLKYTQSNSFAQIQLDIIDGNYTPSIMEDGGALDYFEVEIGNHIRYSAPMGNAGPYFLELQKKWLPYYDEELRTRRLAMTRKSCEYDLEHIPFFVKRGLYFYAFDRLTIAFQKYLQALFITHKVYPIAYNKWIKEQVEIHLNMPELYPKLSPIISISNIESEEINDKVKDLFKLLNSLQ